MAVHTDTYSFDIFLSYSTEPDYRLARRLESFIERFHRSRTAKAERLGSLSACLDSSDFVLSSRDRSEVQRETYDTLVSVPEVLEQHLAKCRQLLVLCSPQSMRSPWVRREIQWFLEQRGAGSIRLALTRVDSSWETPKSFFAPEIIEAGLDKTVWYDLRGFYRDQRGQPKVRDLDSEMLRLVADLHSRSASSIQPLWVREQQRNTRIRYFAISSMFILAAILGSLAYVNWKATQIEKARRIEEASLKQVAQSYRRQYSDPITAAALALQAHKYSESKETAEALDAVHQILIERQRIRAEEMVLVKPGGFSFMVQAHKGKRYTRLSQNGDRVLLVTESRGDPYNPELSGDVFVLDNKTLESVKLDGCDNETQTYRLEYAGFVGEDKILVARAFHVDIYNMSDGRCLAQRSFQLRATKTPITAAGGLLYDVFFIVGSGAGCVWIEEYGGKWLVEPSYELSVVSNCDDKENADAVVDIQVDPSKTLGLIHFQSGRIDLFALDGPGGTPKRRPVLNRGAQLMVFHPKSVMAFVVATNATDAQPARLIRWDISNLQPVLVGEYGINPDVSRIDFIGISTDGNSLVALDSACVLRIWDFETRKLLFSRPPEGLSCPARNSIHPGKLSKTTM